MDRRINFAEMLPKMLFGEKLTKELTYLPKHDASIRNADPGTRLLKLTDIYKVFIPGQMSNEIYHKLYMMTSMSLSQKGTIASVRQLNANRNYMNGGDYHGVATGATSATIIGSSGIGKTTCIQNAVDLLGGIIETEKPLHKIVPVVMVSTPFDCNYKGLLCQILMSIDESLGTNYYEKSQKASINAQQILGMVSQVCNQYIGTLIIDEIQFIVQHKSGSQLYRMILQLINTSCNILLVGTNECLDFFTQSDNAFQMARRSVGLQYGALEFGSEFRNLCKVLFSYQYVKNEAVLTEGLMTWLYEHSAGNPSTLVTLIHDAQEIAILEGRETLGLETLTKAYNNRLQMLHGFINPGLTKKSQTSSKKEIPELPVELQAEEISEGGSDSIIEETEAVREETTSVLGDPKKPEQFGEADTSEVTNKEYVSIPDMVATAKKQKLDIVELMKEQFSVTEVAV